MLRWFTSRFWDPANDTPFNSAEGGYLWIHGGPYDATDELSSRFGDICTESEIDAVIAFVESDGIDSWARIHHDDRDEEEFDRRFALEVENSNTPIRRLTETLGRADNVLKLRGDKEALTLAEQLVYSSLIGALEAYLYETAYFWVSTDDNVLKALVAKLPKYKTEKIPLSTIFDRHEKIKIHVLGYLQNIVWHRWDKDARQVFKCGLGIDLPPSAALDKALEKRHDIVHRSGRDVKGNPVAVTAIDLQQLRKDVLDFATGVYDRIAARINPPPDEEPDLSVADETDPDA